MRYDALFRQYVAPLYTTQVGATEAYSRGISWGLMQVMEQTAREKGVASLSFSTLCDPAVGLAVGCRILHQKLDVAVATPKGVARMNGGGNPDYAEECWRGWRVRTGHCTARENSLNQEWLK